MTTEMTMMMMELDRLRRRQKRQPLKAMTMMMTELNRLKHQPKRQLKNRLNLDMMMMMTLETTTTVAVPRDPRADVALRVPRAVTTMMARVPRAQRAVTMTTTLVAQAPRDLHSTFKVKIFIN
jgi:hypothetical protein